MPGKRVQFDDEILHALNVLARERLLIELDPCASRAHYPAVQFKDGYEDDTAA
jgi:hypothetical protein